ncbi:MAG: hypothetical protein ACREA1_06110 [Nitrosotalea sp.]
MKKQVHYKISFTVLLETVIVYLLFTFFSTFFAVKLVWLATDETFL